jgi:hypothetical protein
LSGKVEFYNFVYDSKYPEYKIDSYIPNAILKNENPKRLVKFEVRVNLPNPPIVAKGTLNLNPSIIFPIIFISTPAKTIL